MVASGYGLSYERVSKAALLRSLESYFRACTQEGKRVLLRVLVREELRDRLDARKVVRELASIVGGGGGGHATMAEAGGRDPERLGEALAATTRVVERLLEGS